MGNSYAPVALVNRGLNWAYFMFETVLETTSGMLYDGIHIGNDQFSAVIRNVYAQLVLMDRGLTSTIQC